MSMSPRLVGPLFVVCTLSPAALASEPAELGDHQAAAPKAGVATNVDVIGEIFARYAYEKAAGDDVREFTLPRARFGADVALDEHFGGRLLVETVPSTSQGSLYGVDGDSLVLRAREVYGEAKSPPLVAGVSVAARFGMVPTLAITPLECQWGRRAVAPSGLEGFGLSAPSDFGATLAVLLPSKLGDLTVGAFNGEGFNQREQNDAKNVGGRLFLRPLATILEPEPGAAGLGVLIAVEDGSEGPTRSRADRYVGGLSFEHRWAAVGGEAVLAHGVFGNSEQRARAYGGWLRVGPLYGAELLGRYDRFDPDYDTAADRDQVRAWRAGVGWHAPFDADADEAFEVYATYGSVSGGVLAEAADPTLPRRGIRIDLRMGF